MTGEGFLEWIKIRPFVDPQTGEVFPLDLEQGFVPDTQTTAPSV